MTNKSGEALNVVAKMFCQAPDIKDLRPEQVAALHVFKHEFLAGGFRLYETVPPEKANPIIEKYLKVLLKELEAEAGGGIGSGRHRRQHRR